MHRKNVPLESNRIHPSKLYTRSSSLPARWFTKHNKQDAIEMRHSGLGWVKKIIGTFKIPSDLGEKATDAFGELNFMGAKNKYAKYIRLSDKTEPSHIYDHLVEEWGLNPPNLIISVTGGASNFSMQSRLTKEFRRSLIKLAESTRAWIVTGGTNTGVMKHVGKAVNEHSAVKSSSEKVVTLGIATWGIVKNRKNLIRPSNDPEWQAEYNINPETINPKTESLLDLNHSHFILVDDGSKNKFGKEIELRTKLEAFIASKHSGNEKVLLVALIVQGGPGSLNTVYNALKEGTPVVVVAGSGGWADILANITNPLITSVDEARIRELHEEFGMAIKEEKLAQWTQTANECIAMKDMLNIYRLDSSVDAQNLDVAILQALLSASSSNPEEKLNLSVAWNRSDLARSSILTDDTYIRLNAPFITAMKEDKHEFVKLFLNHGVDLSTIFPREEILLLYQDSKMLEEKKEKILLYLLKKYSVNKQPNVEKVMKCLMGDEYQICKTQLSDDPLKELFQLCILLNRREMSFVLWESMKEKLSAAIAATKMLKSMAKKAEDKETKEDLQCHADDYEAHAIGILSECYNENEEKTGNLLLRRLPKWGNLTPLQIAVNAKDRAFVSHPAVQILLSQIWKGQLVENTHTLKIIFSALCFPLIFFLISFNGLSKEPTTDHVDDLSSSSDLQEKGLISKENGSTKRSLYKREKLMYFYRAPVVTFWLHVLSYLVFLILFAYVILFNFHPFTPGDTLLTVISPAEFLLWAWVGVLMLDEIYEIIQKDSKSLAGKIRTWFAIHWNKLDMLPIILFFIGIGLRFQPDIQVSRTFLAVSFMVYCWRILNIFVVYKALGPKLIMVGKMIKDMLFFLFILIVFLVSYGVASQALLYPNETDVGKAIQGVLSKPYWQIYGELFLSEIHFDPAADEFTCSNNATEIAAGQRRCPEINRLVPVLSALYMLLASVLLLNLLIAMFSYTFESLTQNTYNLYKFQRYELLEAYYFRSSIMTPFSIFSYIYQLCRYVLTGCKKMEKWTQNSDNKNPFVVTLTREEEKRLILWVQYNGTSYLEENRVIESMSVESKIESMNERLESLSYTVESIQENMNLHIQEQTHLLQAIAHSLKVKLPSPVHHKPLLLQRSGDKRAKSGKASPVLPPKPVDGAVHINSRSPEYPGSKIKRFVVPDKAVSWSVPLLGYNPPQYTSPAVKSQPIWADPPLEPQPTGSTVSLPFNADDKERNVSRKSFTGKYKVVGGLPRNPSGRTGLTGRGLLGRYGPNHAADPVVTRWERDETGTVIKIHGKPVLQFVAICRNDTGEWAIPGGMVDAGENITQTLKREFSEEVLLDDDDQKPGTEIQTQLDKLFNSGVKVYEGYSDDHRNTDISWIETSVFNFHDDSGSTFDRIKLHPGEETNGVQWKRIDQSINLFASHFQFLEKVAKMHNAHF